MTREEFKALCASLLETHTDRGQVSTLLAQIEDGFNEQVAQAENLTSERDKLKADNDSLTQANSKLFLERGVIIDDKGTNQHGDTEDLTVDDLLKGMEV